MSVENPIFMSLQRAITPLISVGVGSAIWKACLNNGLKAHALDRKDLPILKKALVTHYERFWPKKIVGIRTAIAKI